MFNKYRPAIGYITYVIVCFIVFFIFDQYATDNTVFYYAGGFLIFTGLWGNFSKLVLLKIPSLGIKYRYINYFIILIGFLLITIGAGMNYGIL